MAQMDPSEYEIAIPSLPKTTTNELKDFLYDAAKYFGENFGQIKYAQLIEKRGYYSAFVRYVNTNVHARVIKTLNRIKFKGWTLIFLTSFEKISSIERRKVRISLFRL